jgi:hypothetical protein
LPVPDWEALLAFSAGLLLDSLFLVSVFAAESPFEDESEELSLEEESVEEPDEEPSVDAAVSRWRLRVP